FPASPCSRTLFKAADLELVQLIVPAGSQLPTQRTLSESTLQCVEGRVAVWAWNHTQELAAGQLLFLPRSALYSVKSITDSSVLVTSCASHARQTEGSV